jgi:quinol monooxygenase YgiN
MRRVFFAAALLVCASVGSAEAGRSDRLYGVTHVDIAGRGPILEQATDLIREFAADSLKDPGVLRFEILQQDGHPNHFTIYEVWESRRAFEGHLAAAHTRRFREKLQPMLGSPFREQLLRLL